MVHGRTNRFISDSVLALVFYLILATNAGGQGTTGTLLGTVIDKSGGVVAEAVVMATNTETGLNRQNFHQRYGRLPNGVFACGTVHGGRSR